MHSVTPPLTPTRYNSAAPVPPALHLARLDPNPGNLSPRRADISRPCYSKGAYQLYSDFCETGAIPEEESIQSSVAICCLKYGTPELLARFLDSGKVKNLDFSHQFIDLKSARSLAEVLKTNKTLLRLSLSDSSFEAEGFEAVCSALEENATLIALDLSHKPADPKYLDAVIKIVLNNKTLHALELASSGISADTLPSLARALKDNRTLTRLGLGFNALGAEGAFTILKAVEDHPFLRILDLSGNGIGSAGGNSIASLLKTNSTLSEIDLACNALESEGAIAILNAVEGNSTLRSLSLARNNMEASSARAVALLLKNNTALSALDLSGNHQIFADSALDNETIGLIAMALENNTSVTALRLPASHSHRDSSGSRPASVWNWHQSRREDAFDRIDHVLQRNRTFDASAQKDASLASRLFPGQLLSLDEGRLLAGAMIMASPSTAAYEATMVEIQCCVNVLASQT